MSSSPDPPRPPITSVIKPRTSMRKVPAGVAVVMFCAWAVHPGLLAYTFAAGEKGTATVGECVESRRGPATCHGTWRTGSGETGEGEIYNLDSREDEGRTLPVRVGPLGPHGHGWERAWVSPGIGGIVLVLLGLGYTLIYRGVFRRGRKLADELLAAPGALIVSDGGSRLADGSPHTIARALPEAPPGHRRLDLPGRAARHGELGLPKDGRTFFVSVAGTGERPLMLLEHRSEKRLEPETVLHDPSGVPRLLIRRTDGTRFRILDAGGTELGTAAPAGDGGVLSMEVRDADGKVVAEAAGRGLTKWVLRVEPDAPPPLRDAALALAFIQLRGAY
ncbi:hypothetical protein [Actinomadura sp. WMMB 499]|uniref:hypothetical protein n=1 Tax=Actinomadura sp. WMMB 499 TaxID=1219491 RepID=UPI001248B9F4|nr:hypothetical protein [Actinomadura sp. WMMB 499]QFG24714.1 hypothetical protein F7P10_29795 [Actinomadura sp. WMMB 499]